MSKEYYVYILSNSYRGTIYIGVTGNMENRIKTHKLKLNKGFTKKYKINKLVYYETYNTPYEAIQREKQFKNWNRIWKIELTESMNPKWLDLTTGYINGPHESGDDVL